MNDLSVPVLNFFLGGETMRILQLRFAAVSLLRRGSVGCGESREDRYVRLSLEKNYNKEVDRDNA